MFCLSRHTNCICSYWHKEHPHACAAIVPDAAVTPVAPHSAVLMVLQHDLYRRCYIAGQQQCCAHGLQPLKLCIALGRLGTDICIDMSMDMRTITVH